MKANRLVLLALAGAATFSLTGCAQSGNHAAQVGSQVITTSDVDFLARMQCDALDGAAKNPAQSSQVQMVSKRQVRADMVNALVESALDAQLAAKEHANYDTATYRQVMNQFESAVQQAPAADRDRFRTLVGSFYKGQLQVFELAKAALVGQGVASPSQQQIQQAISGLEADYRKSIDLTINPVYGANADGVAGTEDPSLSTPVSSFAKQAVSASPSSSWLSGLPSRQRCG